MASPPFGHDYHDYEATTQRPSIRPQETAGGQPSRLPAEPAVAHGTHRAVTQPHIILAPTDAPRVRSVPTDYQDPYLAQSIVGNFVPRLPPLNTQGLSSSHSLQYPYSSQSPMANYPSFAGDSSTYPSHSTLGNDEHHHPPIIPSMPSYTSDSPIAHSGPGTPYRNEGSIVSSSRPPSASSHHPGSHPGYYRAPVNAYDVIHRPPPHRLLIRQRPSLVTPPFPRGSSSQWSRSARAALPHSASSSSRDPHSRDYPSSGYPHSPHGSQSSHQHHQHQQHEELGEVTPTQVQSIASNQQTHPSHPSHPNHVAAAHPATNPTATLPPIIASALTVDSLHAFFPLDNHEHRDLRVKLLDVMNAPWRLANEQEPESGLLLQFTSKIEENGSEKYRCLFWSEGSECGKHIPRSDRMLEHLRRHIGVRPFVCDCNSDGCPGVFPSKSAMYQHQKNVEPVHCQRCGAQVLRQNLARHWRAQRCQRPDEAAASPDHLLQ